MQGMIGDRKSRNATTLFLVSLSAADLLLLLVCAPVRNNISFMSRVNLSLLPNMFSSYLLCAAARMLLYFRPDLPSRQ